MISTALLLFNDLLSFKTDGNVIGRRIRMLLGIPHPDPSKFCTDPDLDPDPSINMQKKYKKTFILIYFSNFFLLFIYGTDVNVLSKVISKKTTT
jgi:hypothetical protein